MVTKAGFRSVTFCSPQLRRHFFTKKNNCWGNGETRLLIRWEHERLCTWMCWPYLMRCLQSDQHSIHPSVRFYSWWSTALLEYHIYPFQQSYRGETQKAGRLFGYHSVCYWNVSLVHCTGQDPFKDKKGTEGCSRTDRLPDASGSLQRRCKFCLSHVALGEVNLISAFTSRGYKTHFSLGWLKPWEIRNF